MSRAQEIRQKRLNERQENDETLVLAFKAKVNELFEWVLDLLEHPTDANTKDFVILSDSDSHKIRIGSPKGFLTDKPFEPKVMKQLADMFEAEKGYSGEYRREGVLEPYPCVVIVIE